MYESGKGRHIHRLDMYESGKVTTYISYCYASSGKGCKVTEILEGTCNHIR